MGQQLSAVRAQLGPAAVDRRAAGDRWLVYDLADARLRIRLAPDRGPRPGSERVASWTVTFRRDGPLPTEVAASLGLCLQDELEAAPGESHLLRCPLPGPESGDLHSLTARVANGRLVELTAFDEPPEWLDLLTGDES